MPKRTVLFEVQKLLGGKLIDFHGWEMAVQFSGIAREHQTVRASCGIFDLSHMGRLVVDGEKAMAFLSRHACRRLDDIRPGQVRYALVLAQDGTVEDDILISCQSRTSFHVVVNASNKDKILALWQTPAVLAGVQLSDLTESQAMIAVQGPNAAALLAGLGMDGQALRPYSFLDCTALDCAVRLSRTGYTGEDGFECFISSAQVERVWRAVIAAGAIPCGLGARDSLRLEAGMPLYGNELDRSVTPVEAGLTFAINRDGGFIGDTVILEQLRSGAKRRLVGVMVPERRVPRHGYPVQFQGTTIGLITSGTLSPTLDSAIGMAFLPTTHAAVGTALSIDIRGTQVAAQVVALPFYKRARQAASG